MSGEGREAVALNALYSSYASIKSPLEQNLIVKPSEFGFCSPGLVLLVISVPSDSFTLEGNICKASSCVPKHLEFWLINQVIGQI